MSQPWAADWEHIIGCDLVPHLIPAGQGITRTLYVPRRALRSAAVEAGSLRLQSAGTDVEVRLWSGKAAEAAALWLRQMLGDVDSLSDAVE